MTLEMAARVGVVLTQLSEAVDGAHPVVVVIGPNVNSEETKVSVASNLNAHEVLALLARAASVIAVELSPKEGP